MPRNQAAGRKKRGCSCAVLPWCHRNKFLLILLLSTVVGYLLGMSLKSLNLSNQTLYLIGFPGHLVIRAFFMIIVPLLFCSLVLGVSSLRKGSDARMVGLTVGFFLLLSCLSAIMGVTAGHVIHPGQKITTQVTVVNEKMSGRKGLILDSMLDLLWNAIPNNIIQSTFVKEYTHVEIVNLNASLDEMNSTNNSSIVYKKSIKQTKGVNFMGLLMFSILFGSALASMGEKGKELRLVIQQMNGVFMKILGYFLNLLPVGMFFWMFREGLEVRAHDQLFSHLGLFLATAFGCMAIHQFVILPTLYLAIVRKNPVRYHLNLLPAMLTAFGTASSAATLPLTIKCAEESNRLSTTVTRFVLPLGMVVHMNGPTLYIPLSSLFLAQLEGVEIGIAETIMMAITAIILFISAPATPAAGTPIYLLTVMAAGGISKPQFISIFLAIDWFMERFRTVMNIVGDSYVAAFVDKLCTNKISKGNSSARHQEYNLDTIIQMHDEY